MPDAALTYGEARGKTARFSRYGRGCCPPWRERFLSAALRLGGRLGWGVAFGNCLPQGSRRIRDGQTCGFARARSPDHGQVSRLQRTGILIRTRRIAVRCIRTEEYLDQREVIHKVRLPDVAGSPGSASLACRTGDFSGNRCVVESVQIRLDRYRRVVIRSSKAARMGWVCRSFDH